MNDFFKIIVFSNTANMKNKSVKTYEDRKSNACL